MEVQDETGKEVERVVSAVSTVFAFPEKEKRTERSPEGTPRLN